MATGEIEISSSSVGASMVPPVTKACCRFPSTGLSAIAAVFAGKTAPATSAATLASAELPAMKLRSRGRRLAVPASPAAPPPGAVSAPVEGSMTDGVEV